MEEDSDVPRGKLAIEICSWSNQLACGFFMAALRQPFQFKRDALKKSGKWSM